MIYSYIYIAEILKFKIIEFEKYEEVNDAKLYDIKEELFKLYKSPNEHNTPLQNNDFNCGQESNRYSKWMLAISNQVKYMNQDVIFVAISCVTETDMLVKNDESINLDNISEIEEIKIDDLGESGESNHLSGKTVIYKMVLNLKMEKNYTKEWKVENMGGVVLFVHDKTTRDLLATKTYCFIFNACGIHRLKYCDDYIEDLEHFNYPKRLYNELNNLFRSKTCFSRIKNSVFDHYFYIKQYKEGVQVMQLYDLTTMQIRQIFNMHEENKYSDNYSKPILAISKNEQIIAFSSGNGKLSLYLIENGLEIISKNFEKNTKIIACEFKDDDKLMIIIKKSKSKHGEMLLWYLYNSKNRFRPVCKNLELDEDDENPSYNAKIPGKFVSVNSNGSILSIYDSILKIKYIQDKSLAPPYSIVISTDKNQERTPNKMIEMKYDYVHSIFHHDPSKMEPQPFFHNSEPWINKISEKKMWIYLDKEESMQLYIGTNTIQVWRKIMKKKQKFVLEYFWADNDYKNNNTLEVLELIVYYHGFHLTVKWKEIASDQYTHIQWPYENYEIPIQHACNALEYLNYQRNHLNGYDNQHAFEKIKGNISAMIWKFIKNYPDIWRMMDIRYNLMKKIIISGSNPLIKNILFGEHKYLHIPRRTRWADSDHSLSDLQTAIKLYVERNRRILIVTYLLEYYATNASEHPGWLITISDSLPYLYEFKLELYVSELFYKRCMEGIEISNIIEYTDIVPKNFQVALKIKQDFLAFNPISKLISRSKQKISFKCLGDKIELGLKKLYVKIFANEHENYIPTVNMVPLYNFTVNNTPHKREIDDKSFIIKLLRLLFIPRSFAVKNSDSRLLSPFVQVIRLEKNDDIFNNPVMEAVINYKWRPARKYFLQLFFIYIVFATCFAGICGTYLAHFESATRFSHLFSVIIAMVVMSIHATPSFSIKDAFANAVTTQEIAVAITFTMLLLWFEFILYLRLLAVIAGIAHSFLLLLQHPEFTNLDQTENNPARNYVTSFISTYNWLNGEFLQQDTWNFWAVKVITLFGSMLLITILQNMFIAFIWGVYAEAYTKGGAALLRFRAESISDYEALEQIYLYPPIPEPKYIYYLGKSKSYNAWDSEVKSRESEENKLYNDYEEKMIETRLPYVENDDDLWRDCRTTNEDGYEMESDDNNSEDEEDVAKVTSLDKKVEDLKDIVNDLNGYHEFGRYFIDQLLQEAFRSNNVKVTQRFYTYIYVDYKKGDTLRNTLMISKTWFQPFIKRLKKVDEEKRMEWKLNHNSYNSEDVVKNYLIDNIDKILPGFHYLVDFEWCVKKGYHHCEHYEVGDLVFGSEHGVYIIIETKRLNTNSTRNISRSKVKKQVKKYKEFEKDKFVIKVIEASYTNDTLEFVDDQGQEIAKFIEHHYLNNRKWGILDVVILSAVFLFLFAWIINQVRFEVIKKL
ncbi:14158_t:CDS:10 [Funneliformis geosporum]|nr:14158_t:CDS:10 [Funneliformis geosporum]